MEEIRCQSRPERLHFVVKMTQAASYALIVSLRVNHSRPVARTVAVLSVELSLRLRLDIAASATLRWATTSRA